MAKVKHPLESFRARGRFAGVLDYRDYPAGETFESRVYIQPGRKKPDTVGQKKKESWLKEAAGAWRSLSEQEKSSWDRVAFDYHNYGAEYVWRPEFSAYHKFMSHNLRRLAKGLKIITFFLEEYTFTPRPLPVAAASWTAAAEITLNRLRILYLKREIAAETLNITVINEPRTARSGLQEIAPILSSAVTVT